MDSPTLFLRHIVIARQVVKVGDVGKQLLRINQIVVNVIEITQQ